MFKTPSVFLPILAFLGVTGGKPILPPQRRTGEKRPRRLPRLGRWNERPTEPNRHWNAYALRKAGLRKYRVFSKGRRLTMLVPVGDWETLMGH